MRLVAGCWLSRKNLVPGYSTITLKRADASDSTAFIAECKFAGFADDGIYPIYVSHGA